VLVGRLAITAAHRAQLQAHFQFQPQVAEAEVKHRPPALVVVLVAAVVGEPAVLAARERQAKVPLAEVVLLDSLEVVAVGNQPQPQTWEQEVTTARPAVLAKNGLLAPACFMPVVVVAAVIPTCQLAAQVAVAQVAVAAELET